MSDTEINYEELLKDPDINRVSVQEGRPYIGRDNTYSKQRRDRLGDCVSDYLTDEEITPQQFYQDLLAELDDWVQYHQKAQQKYADVMDLVTGNSANA